MTVLRDFPGTPKVTDLCGTDIANYPVRIPERCAWNVRPGLREGAISVFTDGSKIKVVLIAGVYREGLTE